MKYSVVISPTSEPVSLAEAKLHLRLLPNDNSEDELIKSLTTAAREYCENFTGRALATQTLEMCIEAFPHDAVELPMPPLQDVISVKYRDKDGTESTLNRGSDYLVSTKEIGRIVPPYGKIWPQFTPYPVDPVSIRFVAGFTSDLPRSIKQAMLFLIGHWYENREAVVVGAVASVEIEFAVKCLLSMYKVRWF